MPNMPTWNNVRGPDSHIQDRLAAGEVFSKATTGISNLLQKEADRQRSDAQSNFDAILASAESPEQITQLKAGFQNKQIPGQDYLSPDVVMKGMNERVKTMENEAFAKLQREDQVTQIKDTRKNKLDTAALTKQVPDYIDPETGAMNTKAFTQNAVLNGMHPDVIDKVIQKHISMGENKEKELKLNESTAVQWAINKAIDPVTKKVNDKKAQELLESKGYKNAGNLLVEHMKNKNAPANYQTGVMDAAREKEVNKVQEKLSGLKVIAGRMSDDASEWLLNDIALIEDVMLSPDTADYRKLINDSGGLDAVVSALSSGSNPDSSVWVPASSEYKVPSSLQNLMTTLRKRGADKKFKSQLPAPTPGNGTPSAFPSAKPNGVNTQGSTQEYNPNMIQWGTQ